MLESKQTYLFFPKQYFCYVLLYYRYVYLFFMKQSFCYIFNNNYILPLITNISTFYSQFKEVILFRNGQMIVFRCINLQYYRIYINILKNFIKTTMIQFAQKQSGYSNQSLQSTEAKKYYRYQKQGKNIGDQSMNSCERVASQRNKDLKECSNTDKQYRQNYSSLTAKRTHQSEWTITDEQILFQKYLQFGSKWKKIAMSFEDKSENSLKNKFYGSIRKLIRKLNKISAAYGKLKKPLKYHSIIKPLEIEEFPKELSYSDDSTFQDLKKQIIEILKDKNNELSDQVSLEVVKKINKFNIVAKCFRSKGLNKHAPSTHQNIKKKHIYIQQSQISSPVIQSSHNSHSILNYFPNQNQTQHYCKVEDDRFPNDHQLIDYCNMPILEHKYSQYLFQREQDDQGIENSLNKIIYY